MNSGASPGSDSTDLGGGFGGESEYPDFHRSTRMPLDAVVRLHFEGTVAYQNGFAANVSATGMYVKHPDPPPIGTRLVFELVLGEERKPVQGAGVVAWTREKYEGPGRPAGIGIQFTEIDALSRQHIAEALFAYLESQLGDELAESQDVVDLVATTSTRTPLDLVESIGRGEEAEAPPAHVRPPAPAPLFEIEETLSDAAAASPALRPLDREPEPLAVAAEGGLFTPAIPPDEPIEARASVGRRPKSPWPAVALGFAVAAAAFAGWWFFFGPGSVEEVPVVAAPPSARRPVEPEPPSEPAREPLDPEIGAGTTLAQEVGAQAVQAPEPLPADAETGGAAKAPAAESPASAETDAEPPATTAGAETATPAPSPPSAEPAAPAARVAAANPETSARATRVRSIAWEESTGATRVVLSGDGPFPVGSYKWNEIRGDNPRVLLRFTQMASGYPKSLLAAGTPELEQVRVGFHEKASGNELHVVLDLGALDVKVESVESSGDQVVVLLRR